MQTKPCSCCHKELPTTKEYFCKDKSRKDGFNNRCRECQKKYIKKYFAEIISDEAREKRKERSKDLWKAYRAEHVEKIKEKNRNYMRINRDKIHEYRNNKSEEAKQKEKERIRIYVRNNLDKYRANEQKRRALQLGVESDFTKEMWEQTLIYFNGKCSYCGSNSKLEQDHFIPLSKGGGYIMYNILPACKKCNSSKHANEFDEWYRKQRFYDKDKESKINKFVSQSSPPLH